MKTTEKQKRVRLEESPYTYVRTRVMRTLLIPRQEYRKLLKMSLPEISHYLSESGYGKEMNELGVRFSGIELIEQALNRNFANTIEKLKRISPDSYNEFLDAYLLKYDIDNLKTIIRGKRAGLPEAEIRELLLPAGKLSARQLDDLLKQESAENVLKAAPFPVAVAHREDLSGIETGLDRFLYGELFRFAERMPRQGALFREFLLTIIETINLVTFLRLKREKAESKEVEKHLFLVGKDELFRHLLKAKSHDEIATTLQKSRYKDLFDGVKPFEGSLIPIEIGLANRTLRKTLLFERQNPLSVYVILTFLFAKEIEIVNLKRIIKAKHLGMPMERIEQYLVAA